ncbi:PRC-barrel domain-containing protein [Indioceanicola profundi]|uniref:PRC-barrel domain-containing protein n=1 Tax=Indioceanicola profundi TaxID=2220096 RepID=UPI000E6AB8F6|nr:PRC-barrel domain-containing protein [Indioceanicola profundi]
MRKNLIAAVSSIGLLVTGAAYAQEASPTAPPAAGQSEPAITQPGMTEPSATQDMAGTASVDATSADNLLGRTVVGSDGEELGEVEDVILNASTGDVEQLVISSGGILGIGGKSIAVDFADATFDQEQEQVRLSNLTSAQVEEMPDFEYQDSTVSLGRGNADSVGGTQTEPMEAAPAEKPEQGQ